MTTAERLIYTILSRPERADDGILANDLLHEFHKGFPISALQPLLSNGNENVVRIAAFIASELGSKARPLLKLMVRLLDHPNRFIRADAICSILTCTYGDDESEIASVISLINDPESPIRWKAMEFLSLASIEQLKAGLRRFQKAKTNSDHIIGLDWLVNKGRDLDEVVSWLSSDNSIRRKYGVVAAARLWPSSNNLLELASTTDDADIKQFADSILLIKGSNR